MGDQVELRIARQESGDDCFSARILLHMFSPCTSPVKANASSRHHERERLRKTLKGQCTQIFANVKVDSRGEATCDDILALLPAVERLFEAEGISFARHDFEIMVDIMDLDDSGGIDKTEFCRGIVS